MKSKNLFIQHPSICRYNSCLQFNLNLFQSYDLIFEQVQLRHCFTQVIDNSMIKVFHYKAAILFFLILFLGACASSPMHPKSNVVNYLYPASSQKIITPTLPQLSIPLSVGLAFVPTPIALQRQATNESLWSGEVKPKVMAETRKQALLKIISFKLKQHNLFESVQIIPPEYLSNNGSFVNLDKIQTMYGIDTIALIGFDQIQFFSEGEKTQNYWTLAGPHPLTGNQYDTATLIDTSVYHLKSQNLLFRAQGTSLMKARTKLVNLTQELSEDSNQGFDFASNMMFRNIELQIERFSQKIPK